MRWVITPTPLALGIDATISAMVSGIGDAVVNGLPNLSRIIGKVPQALKTALQNAKDKVLTEALVKAIVAELRTVTPSITDDQARLMALSAVREAKAAQAITPLAAIEKDIVQYLPSLKRAIGDDVPETLLTALLAATRDNTPLNLQGLKDELRKLKPSLSDREVHLLALEAVQEARVARGMAGANKNLRVSEFSAWAHNSEYQWHLGSDGRIVVWNSETGQLVARDIAGSAGLTQWRMAYPGVQLVRASRAPTILTPHGGGDQIAVPVLKGITPGAQIGMRGLYKTAYEVVGDPTRAVVVLNAGEPASVLREELAALAKLQAEGLPTVRVFGITEIGRRPALVMERYAQSSKTVVDFSSRTRSITVVGNSQYLNERSIQDLTAIRQRLVERNLFIEDLQFLIGHDGRVVINDPLGGFGSAFRRDNLETIDQLINVAKGGR